MSLTVWSRTTRFLKQATGAVALVALLSLAYDTAPIVSVRAALGQQSGIHAHALDLYLNDDVGSALEVFEPLVSSGFDPALETLCEFVAAKSSSQMSKLECLADVRGSDSQRLYYLTELLFSAQEWSFAEKFIEKRIFMGDATAHFDLARLKILSQPDAPTEEDVLVQLRLAAEAGDPRGQYAQILRILGQENSGFLNHAIIASVGRNPALTSGDAYFELAKLIQRDLISSDLSYSEILRRADVLGNKHAAGYLSQYLLSNPTLDPDGAQTLYWLERAAHNGDSVAQYNLSLRLYKNAQSSEELDISVDLLRASASSGFRPAVNQLGVLYWQSPNILATTDEEGRQIAIQWFANAAEQGDPNAMFNLGQIYMNNGRVDEGTAMLANSANLGNTAAAELLSRVRGG